MPIFKPIQIPLNGHLSVVSIALLSFVSSENLLRVHLLPQSMSLIKMVKSTGPKTDPCGMLLITGLLLDTESLTSSEFLLVTLMG